MKTNIQTSPKFVVNKEEGVVVCIMEVTTAHTDSASFGFSSTKIQETKAPKVYNVYRTFTVIGKAKCCPSDVFDEAIGRRIAESRAKSKAFKIIKNVWRNIAQAFYNEYNKAMEMHKNCESMEKFELNHVKELSE